MSTDTVDSLLVTSTEPVLNRFGWTTFDAVELKQLSQIVLTTTGEVMTVRTMRTSLSRAFQVLLLLLLLLHTL